jgi:hypothetical protein
MRHRMLAAAVGVVAAVVCVPGSALAAPGRSHERVCGQAQPGYAACLAEVVTSAKTDKPLARPKASTPSGYFPADLHSAYALPTTGGAGQTIAIVDAYDDPTAEADLGVYRSQFGLGSCTTSNGCFRKVNQTGGTTPPRADAGWAEEISLDVDMASAICPSCRILLVEASSSSLNDLGTAVNTAASLGATQISNSYGGSEFSTESSAESFYNHPGIAITASSGDAGYGVEFPAASRYVTAVGGTTLRLLGLRAQAVVAARHRLCAAHGRRRLGGRQPEYRRGGLRLDAVPGLERLAGVRRDERLGSDHRRRLRAGGQPADVVHLRPDGVAVRRDERVERLVRRLVPVHRGRRLRRAHRPRHAERHRRVLSTSPYPGGRSGGCPDWHSCYQSANICCASFAHVLK